MVFSPLLAVCGLKGDVSLHTPSPAGCLGVPKLDESFQMVLPCKALQIPPPTCPPYMSKGLSFLPFFPGSLDHLADCDGVIMSQGC